MKILFIHDYPFRQGGGIEVQTYLDAVALSKRGYQVTIASTRASSETYTDKGSSEDVSISCIKIVSSQQLEQLIKDNDLVSIQATFSLRRGMMDALRILNKLNKKHIVCLHTSYKHIPFSALAKVDEYEKNASLSQFAEYLKSDLCYIQGVSGCFDPTLNFLEISKKYTIVHNAKDWNRFLESINKNITPVDITYVGEISWMKGMHTLVDSLLQVKKRYPDVKVRIIGNGQDREDVKALVACHEISNVEFFEYIENEMLSAFLVATKVVVVPSLTETWCNLAMEALGCGTQVVASRVEGLIELLEDARLGTLFDPGNAYELAQAIQANLGDPSSLDHSKYIKEKYTMEKRISELENLYRRIVVQQ